MSAPEPEPGRALLAEVAVAVPLAEPLTYAVPPALAGAVAVGLRVRVPIGKRKALGVVLGLHHSPPAGVRLREVESVVDHEPVLPPDLIELARFVSGYYLAPLGEVLRAFLPQELGPWGDRKIWLTDRGALAPARSAEEEEILSRLRGGERLRLSELRRQLPWPHLASLVDRLVADSRLASGDEGRSGRRRFVAAFELAAGTAAALAERCGRSAAGRRTVEYLSAIGRPATASELASAVEASPAVLRRLAELGVLRRFSQVETLSLAHHQLSRQERAPLILREDQDAALAALTAALEDGHGEAFLLAGMTGAGKTEVYLRAAERALALGRTALLLVPEIALVPALASLARERFGGALAILHSGLSSAERQQEWERARRGEARIVLGPRSAVLAPLESLGLLVVDEEQDSSYKQDSVPRYHGRDLALVRARALGAVAVLISATPSLESRLNVRRGRLRELRLTVRAGQGKMPEGILVDLRQERAIPRHPGEAPFSARLSEELGSCLAAGDQAILLRNRRGYSPILLCRACGNDLRCEQCGLPRTFHRREGRMVCHYCGSHTAAPPRCPSCSEAALEPIGAGTERVEESFRERFPGIAAEVLDRDAVRRPGGAAAVLERFARGEAQVLIGTQMVSKGHHFPRVALTAVLTADSYLGFPDFRAVERTYTLLAQLAGRAGRGEKPGRVVIQTYHPDHYAIRAALSHDDARFAAEEMRFRQVFHYPPFTRMVHILMRDTNRRRVEEAIRELAATLLKDPAAAEVRITGPAPAPLERLRNEWRFQLLLRGPSGKLLRDLVSRALRGRAWPTLMVDVDPYHLL